MSVIQTRHNSMLFGKPQGYSQLTNCTRSTAKQCFGNSHHCNGLSQLENYQMGFFLMDVYNYLNWDNTSFNSQTTTLLTNVAQ